MNLNPTRASRGAMMLLGISKVGPVAKPITSAGAELSRLNTSRNSRTFTRLLSETTFSVRTSTMVNVVHAARVERLGPGARRRGGDGRDRRR